MRNFVFGILATITLLMIYGYTTTNDKDVWASSSRTVYNLPIKQKNVVVTQNHDYMLKLIKKGYVVEDVDIITWGYHHNTVKKYYTLIKY